MRLLSLHPSWLPHRSAGIILPNPLGGLHSVHVPVWGRVSQGSWEGEGNKPLVMPTSCYTRHGSSQQSGEVAIIPFLHRRDLGLKEASFIHLFNKYLLSTFYAEFWVQYKVRELLSGWAGFRVRLASNLLLFPVQYDASRRSEILSSGWSQSGGGARYTRTRQTVGQSCVY